MLVHGTARIPFALALLALGTLLAAGSGSASSAGAGCTRSSSLYQASPTSTTHTSAIHSYDDYIEDVASAPDVCQSNLVTNDNVSITMAIDMHDRSNFSAGDGYRIYLDTDSNPATGSVALPGEPAGAEFFIEILDEESSLQQWNGTSFAAVSTQSPIMTVWLPDYGPILEIARRDLGDPQSFTFVIVTSNGTDRDLAPDSGSWRYTVSALQLTAGRLAVGKAVAGKPLAASMQVTRSDFDIPLDQGAIACVAQLAGKRLVGKGRFADDRVGCTWRVPRDAGGTRLSGSVAVTFQGVTAKRSFNVRVK